MDINQLPDPQIQPEIEQPDFPWLKPTGDEQIDRILRERQSMIREFERRNAILRATNASIEASIAKISNNCSSLMDSGRPKEQG